MTPTEVNNAARDLYNAATDTFFTDSQMYNWQLQACHELAKKAWLIESIYTTPTILGTQAYAFPTYTMAVKRIAINGKKIKPLTMREDDAATLSNAVSATTGWPAYYFVYANVIYLRPIPDTVYTMTLFAYDDAAPIDATSTLQIPTLFHMDLVDFVLMRMFEKDKDFSSAGAQKAIWDGHVTEAISYQRRKKRTDSFATVQSEDNLPSTIFGEV